MNKTPEQLLRDHPYGKLLFDFEGNEYYSVEKQILLELFREYAAQFEPKWLPIESAPKNVSLHKLNKQLVGWWDDESWVWSRGYYDFGRWWYNTEIEINPTHFLPIPQPPQTEEL